MNMIEKILVRKSSPVPVLGDGEQIRCFTNIADVAGVDLGRLNPGIYRIADAPAMVVGGAVAAAAYAFAAYAPRRALIPIAGVAGVAIALYAGAYNRDLGAAWTLPATTKSSAARAQPATQGLTRILKQTPARMPRKAVSTLRSIAEASPPGRVSRTSTPRIRTPTALRSRSSARH